MSTDQYGYVRTRKPKRQQERGNLSGEFALDRIEFPIYYVPASIDNSHKFSTETVLAESSTHSDEDWITLGIVSSESPLGQGTYCGFRRSEMILATQAQVLQALQREHPFSAIWEEAFRPSCQELQNAALHMTMSGALSNWTTDEATFQDPAFIPVSRRQIRDFADEARERYNEIMKRWEAITRAQIDFILDQLEQADQPQQ